MSNSAGISVTPAPRPVVVVGVDGSVSSARALKAAAGQAQRMDARLVVATVRAHTEAGVHAGSRMAWTQRVFSGRDMVEVSHVAENVEQFVAETLDDGVRAEVEVRDGDPAGEMIALAAELDAAILVVGRRGRGGFASLLLGSVSDQCATHANCPVMVVGLDLGSPAGPIVVGVDGSPGGFEAMDWAVQLAKATGSSLRLVSAWETPPMIDSYVETAMIVEQGPEVFSKLAHHALEAGLTQCRDQAPSVAAYGDVIHGNASDVLTKIAAGGRASMLVVGSRGFGRFKSLLLGSVARQTLHHATTPVVVIHPVLSAGRSAGKSTSLTAVS